MPDVGHVCVGMLAARAHDGRRPGWGSMAAFSALSLLPDLDLIGRWLGYADGSALGHRGALHSLAFAAAAGLAAAAIGRALGLPPRKTALFSILVVASHGFLDMLDRGNLGVAYLWPLTSRHFFLPWRFLPGPPPGERWLSVQGAEVVALGALPFLPLAAAAVLL